MKASLTLAFELRLDTPDKQEHFYAGTSSYLVISIVGHEVSREKRIPSCEEYFQH